MRFDLLPREGVQPSDGTPLPVIRLGMGLADITPALSALGGDVTATGDGQPTSFVVTRGHDGVAVLLSRNPDTDQVVNVELGRGMVQFPAQDSVMLGDLDLFGSSVADVRTHLDALGVRMHEADGGTALVVPGLGLVLSRGWTDGDDDGDESEPVLSPYLTQVAILGADDIEKAGIEPRLFGPAA